jgi:hypothetical protein
MKRLTMILVGVLATGALTSAAWASSSSFSGGWMGWFSSPEAYFDNLLALLIFGLNVLVLVTLGLGGFGAIAGRWQRVEKRLTPKRVGGESLSNERRRAA